MTARGSSRPAAGSPQDIVLGVDVGTSETKAVAVRADGRVLATASRQHEAVSPAPGRLEHDAERDWWDGLVRTVRDLVANPGVDPAQVVAMTCSGIGPCVLPVAADGTPLRSAILYGADTRATAQIEVMERELGGQEIRRRCGNDLSSQSAGPKIAWLRDEEPDVFEAARWFLTCQSFLVLRLTGRVVVDHTTASYHHPLYSLAALAWDQEWCALLGVDGRLPDIAWAGEPAGALTPHAAQLLGLPPGIVVGVGTADAPAEALSCGVLDDDAVMVMYGSSGFFIAPTRTPAPGPGLYCAPSLRPGRWTRAGGTSTAGSFLRWTIELLGLHRPDGTPDDAALVQLAAQSPPGARGLTALPYLLGERTPVDDPDARAAFVGISMGHTRADLARAAVEAVAASMSAALLYVLDAKPGAADPDGSAPRTPHRRVVAVGGGTRNDVWLQAVSDMTGLTQHTTRPGVGACYGDAMLAAAAVGALPDLEAGLAWVSGDRTVTPTPDRPSSYADAPARQLELYRTLSTGGTNREQ